MIKNPEKLTIDNLTRWEDNNPTYSIRIFIKRTPLRILYSLEIEKDKVIITSHCPNSIMEVVPDIIKTNHNMSYISDLLSDAWQDGLYLGKNGVFYPSNKLLYTFLSYVGVNRILTFERKIDSKVPVMNKIINSLMMKSYRITIERDNPIKWQRYYCVTFDSETRDWLRKIAGSGHSLGYKNWFENYTLMWTSSLPFPELKDCSYKI